MRLTRAPGDDAPPVPRAATSSFALQTAEEGDTLLPGDAEEIVAQLEAVIEERRSGDDRRAVERGTPDRRVEDEERRQQEISALIEGLTAPPETAPEAEIGNFPMLDMPPPPPGGMPAPMRFGPTTAPPPPAVFDLDPNPLPDLEPEPEIAATPEPAFATEVEEPPLASEPPSATAAALATGGVVVKKSNAKKSNGKKPTEKQPAEKKPARRFRGKPARPDRKRSTLR